MAFGGQQRDLGALALQQRIGGNRGAVNEAIGRGEHLRTRHAQASRQLFQAGHHADRLVGRRGRRFREDRAAGLIRGDQVGIGAADVNSDREHD